MLENGLRVGLVGACTPFVRIWEKPETVAQLEIEEPADAIRRALQGLPGVDVKVLIYHGGFECDLQTGVELSGTGENQACMLCRMFDFDVLLAGHQHVPVGQAVICGTHAVQTASNGRCFACVDVEVGEGCPLQVRSRLMPPAAAPLKGAKAALMPIETMVQAWLDLPAGYIDVPLIEQPPLERALYGSCWPTFVNTVQLWASGADISACSLPNEFRGMGKEVTVRDVVSTYVYANTLKVLRITGRALRAYVEHTASYFSVKDGRACVNGRFLRPKTEHYNYDYFSGMDYTIDLRRPVGARVTSMRRDGREIAPDAELRLCVNSYRASGTGGYGMLPGLPVERDIQSDVAGLMIRYIEEKTRDHGGQTYLSLSHPARIARRGGGFVPRPFSGCTGNQGKRLPREAMGMHFEVRRETEGDFRAVEELTREAFWNLNSPGCEEALPRAHTAHACGLPAGAGLCRHARRRDCRQHTLQPLARRGCTHRHLRPPVRVACVPAHGGGLGARPPYASALPGDGASRGHHLWRPGLLCALWLPSGGSIRICTADGMYAAALQALELFPGALDGVHGRFFESPAFEVDVYAAEAFDKGFPPASKARNAFPAHISATRRHAPPLCAAMNGLSALHTLTQISRPVRARWPCPACAFLL